MVLPDSEPAVDDPLAGWMMRKQSGVRADVILCGASEFEDARDTPNTLAYEASHNGVAIRGH